MKDINQLKNYWLSEEEKAKITGWDFSYIDERYHSEDDNLPWDYYSLIKENLLPSHTLLDMDTGGGEFLLTLEHDNSLTTATEGYAPNVLYCKEKLSPLGITVVEMTDYSSMPFADESFDTVINRHGSFDAKEIYRILKKGGRFITQQVGEDNEREIVKMLLPENEKPFPGMNLVTQKKIFEDAGFTTVSSGEAFLPIEFYETGALVWFAKIIEWEFEGFSVEKCFDNLLKVHNEIEKNGKVSGTIHRYYMVMEK